MRIVQRVQAEEMNANKHKRKKVEMFTEARPEKGAGERSAMLLALQLLSQDTSDHSVPSTALLPWQV